MQNNYYYTGICSNIYKKPSNYTEVISQIIYGERFKILSKNKDWIKIKTLFDNYKGYIKNYNYIIKFNPEFKVS
ncbi:SH3 domain-containing protein, partial [Candidatus Pelagibacter sp.]|nr:SH3 domain-containing protein [Candidatus Pelagibacter sp.]